MTNGPEVLVSERMMKHPWFPPPWAAMKACVEEGATREERLERILRGVQWATTVTRKLGPMYYGTLLTIWEWRRDLLLALGDEGEG